MSHLQESGAAGLPGTPEHFLHLPQPGPPICAARARGQVASPALRPSAPHVEDEVQPPRGQGQNSSKSLFQVADSGQGTTASPSSGTSHARATAPHTPSPPRWSLLQSWLPSETVIGRARGPTTLTRKGKGGLRNCMTPRQVRSLLERTQGDRTGSPHGRDPAGASALPPRDSAG